MSKSRVEAFYDACIAIVMTLLVLDLNAPASGSLRALAGMEDKFFVYTVSFFILAVTWVSHHQLFRLAEHVDFKVLWANVFMIFGITLNSFAASWLGDHWGERFPSVFFAFEFFIFNFGYYLIFMSLLSIHREGTLFYSVWGKDRKIYAALAVNVLVIIGTFFFPILFIYIGSIVPLMWVLPNKKVTEAMKVKRKLTEEKRIKELIAIQKELLREQEIK